MRLAPFVCLLGALLVGCALAQGRVLPDGGIIVFHSAVDGNNEIYLMDVVRGLAANLTHHEGEDYYPSWSPDGNRILFVSDRDGDVEMLS